MSCFGLIISSLLFLEPSIGLAQSGSRPAAQPGQPQTAEDLLRALQADRPVSEVIEPASRAGKGPISDDQALLPEGAVIVERSGRLARQAGGWDFQPTDGRSITLLPNAHLESMVTMHNDADGELPFVVSGEITVFGTKNFLLVKHFTRGAVENREPGEARPAQPTGIRSDASAEDVLSALQSQQPGITSGTQREDDRGRAKSGGGTLMDGSLVIRRSGRLLQQANRWTFEFEDEQASYQKVVELLPNQSLEIMTHAADRGSSGLVFVVSGEMTQFGGENYLLVRGVTRQLDLGNLRP